MKWFGIMSVLAIFVLPLGCSEDSPSGPVELRDGIIIFSNESLYAVTLNTLTQTHEGRTKTATLERVIYPRTRYQLRNLFTEDEIFPGGDVVFITFASRAYNPADPNNPLFSSAFSFTVNGSATLLVKGAGQYEVRGG